MKNQRPKNLNLLTIRLPIPAIVSILHRISGLLLFLLIPFLLWGLNQSLTSEDTFIALRDCLTTPLSKFVVWFCLSGFLYHLVAGIRHLLMDMGVGESLKGGRLSAVLTMIISAVLIILAGIWIW